ncbi:MAG TPA: hypothetical protein VGI54_08375 [Solirubrobacteraceae bacterium]
MVLQVVVGGFAAVAVSLKLFWRRIMTFLHLRKPDDEPVASPVAPTPTPPTERPDSERAATR